MPRQLLDDAPGQPAASWSLIEDGLRVARVLIVSAVALAAFLLIAWGYMTVPLAAPLGIGLFFGALKLARQLRPRR